MQSEVTNDTAELVDQVNQIRLDEDLSYEDLAEQMQLAGAKIDASVIQRTIKKIEKDPGHKPHDRTLHKFRKFLDARRRRGSRRRGGR